MFNRAEMKSALCVLAGCASLWLAGARAGGPVVAPVPAPVERHWEAGVETGVMFGLNNPNDYVTAPQIFSLRWQPAPEEPFFATPLKLRWQFTFGLVAVPFVHGPESHYFGLAVGRRMNFRKPGSRFGGYIEGRFAVGAIDSSGPRYGQGQDLTFSALVGAGATFQLSERARLGLGFLYEHFSNGGLSEPEVENVGLDTVGPNLSLQVTF